EVQTRINSQVGGTANAQALNTIELGYSLNGRPLVDFEINHEKKNHVIVVSEDLETYAHIHPELARGGTFSIRVNDYPRVYDPDNQDAARAIPKGGNYFVFTEVQPKGAKAPELVVTGFTAVPAAPKTPLVADPVARDKSIVKFFSSDLKPSRQ